MLIEIILVGLALMVLERMIPDQTLPVVPRWWLRVVLINMAQLGVVVAGGYTWDIWLKGVSLFKLPWELSDLAAGFTAYLILTFVYYWWHRLRHQNNFLWLTFHQLHHSPARIETITSFYKHPIEIFANSILTGLVTYGLLGLSIEGAAWTTFFGSMAEFFYHMNIKTPHWVGYIIQRPEMHRVHHRRGFHFNNFGDLPIWDKLFGTYENPVTNENLCGYPPERELQVVKMLTFRNVNNPVKEK